MSAEASAEASASSKGGKSKAEAEAEAYANSKGGSAEARKSLAYSVAPSFGSSVDLVSISGWIRHCVLCIVVLGCAVYMLDVSRQRIG